MRILARNVVLAVVLAGLVAASALLRRPPAEAEAKGPLVPGFDAAAVARIEIRAAGKEGVTLDRGADDLWRVRERDDFVAYPFPVLALLAGVENLSRADRVGEEVGAHDLYGVGEDGTRIDLLDRALRPLVRLVQGVPEGLTPGSNVRLAAEAEVFRAPSFGRVDAEPKSWIDTRLLPFAVGEAVAMTVSHDSGRVLVDLRRSGGAWLVPSPAEGPPERAPKPLVDAILLQASTLVFTDLVQGEVDPEHGFGSPPRTMVEVELASGGREALWIGEPVPPPSGALQEHYFATNPGWEVSRLATLSAGSAERLFRSIEDLAAAVAR